MIFGRRLWRPYLHRYHIS